MLFRSFHPKTLSHVLDIYIILNNVFDSHNYGLILTYDKEDICI